MTRRRPLLVVVLGLAGCATVAPPPPPAAAPAPAPAPEQPAPRPPTPPSPAAPRQSVALALVEQGRTVQKEKGEGGAAEAIALYRQALAEDPSCAAALWELGWSEQLRGRHEAALEAWVQVQALDPGYPELAEHLPELVERVKQLRLLEALPDPGPLPPRDEVPAAGPALAVAAVGDVQMGMAWPPGHVALPPDDARDLFDGVKASLAAADVRFGNLETVLADQGESKKCGKKSTKCYAFRVPTSFTASLKAAAFDVMSIANNHAGDFGPEGRRSTMAALDAAGIRHSGPVGDIASWEVAGRRVALVGFSFGSDVYRIQDLALARKLVADLRKRHDLVIVSFHGGAEGTSAAHVPGGVEMFLGENRGDVRAFAHTVVDAGADLVLGHSPHLLRGMELYRGRLIAYSLGNFSTWDTFNLTGPLGVTGILKVTLAANGVATRVELVPAVIAKPGRPVLDPTGQGVALVRKLSAEDFGAALLDEKGVWVMPAAPVQALGPK
ncbi:MAG TPA: CapA family protein [Myxococcaceae bacterium]|nr:CapA family protein [Myxococcaceae bacterium]